MKVILKKTVPNVGKEGQVVKVKDGFARNFLFPQGMATVADKAQLRVLEARNNKVAATLEATKSSAQDLAAKIDGKKIRMEVKAGTGHRLFGAVTSQDIADAIKQSFGVEVEKKTVGILQPIKQLGHYSIEIDLHRFVDCKIHLDVVDPVLEEAERKAAENRGEVVAKKEEVAPVAQEAETAPEPEPATVE